MDKFKVGDLVIRKPRNVYCRIPIRIEEVFDLDFEGDPVLSGCCNYGTYSTDLIKVGESTNEQKKKHDQEA
jgi:hypothetical protein